MSNTLKLFCKQAATESQAASVVSPDTKLAPKPKVALETEKEKDDAVEELKRQLQPMRARTHDAGDDHEMITEVDNWDLNVHHRETTRVPNRRNVTLGSHRVADDLSDSCFKSGTPQRVLTMKVLRW